MNAANAQPSGPTIRDRFERIYATGEWGIGSGEGSLASDNAGYIKFLQGFLRNRNIKTVVDLGCGDWQTSRHINWNGVAYKGFDLVRPVIERNRASFGAANIEFAEFSGDFTQLPPADLLIVKDVLQHWSNESVHQFLPTLQRYSLALITNCVVTRGVTPNNDIADGDFRRLDIRRPPFSIPAEELYSYVSQRPLWRRLIGRPHWRKVVLLVKGSEL